MNKGTSNWAGIFPSLCTPFTEDGAIDLEAQRAVVRFALAAGAHGLVCFGLAGEVYKLTPEERKRLTYVIIEEVNHKIPVLVGVGANSEHTAVDLARVAERAGADGIVIAPPMYPRVPDEILRHYFLSVAASVDLPVVLQDAPEYLDTELSPLFVQQLSARQPNIRYVKVEFGPEETSRWVAELGPDINVFTGGGGIQLPACLSAGAVGNIPGVELTDFMVSIYMASAAGDSATASSTHRRLLPYLVFSSRGIEYYNACAKEMLVRRGVLPHGGLRMPGLQLGALAMRMLGEYSEALGLSGGSPASAARSKPSQVV